MWVFSNIHQQLFITSEPPVEAGGPGPSWGKLHILPPQPSEAPGPHSGGITCLDRPPFGGNRLPNTCVLQTWRII